jgi:hypothetical protein
MKKNTEHEINETVNICIFKIKKAEFLAFISTEKIIYDVV